jgi:Cohesin domain
MMRQLVAALAISLGVLLGQPGITSAVPTVTAGSATVNVGDTFSIDISIADATDLTAWQLDLGFDPAIVQANGVTEGPFMSSFGATLFGPGVIDNVSGLISLITNSYVDLPPNPSGSGVLAEIEFTALATGISPLTLSSVFLNLEDSGFDVVKGQVTVGTGGTGGGSAPVPEASTVALIAVGLGVLAARRWTAPGRPLGQ